jgi:hypothetical protein|tara:strand:- start:754 stop:1080 length:327 start_codon:yes stop_codon:yes gene_type:complete
MFFKNTNKEVIMKNNQEKAAMTAAEKLGEALVLKPEWEVKPKSVIMTHVFSVTFNESTKELQLEVNGDVYQTLKCKDILNGKIKFHNGLNEIINKFNLWRFDEPKSSN